jgi:hypothetical protein
LADRTTFDDFLTERTMEFQPEVNPSIPDSQLQFDPPIKKPATAPVLVFGLVH